MTEQIEKQRLAQMLKPGDTVYAVLRHKSASGLKRVVTLHTFGDGGLLTLTYNAARVLDLRTDSAHDDGIVMCGTGYNVVAEIVKDLAYALFGSVDALRCEWI